jgi:hypothetical protein
MSVHGIEPAAFMALNRNLNTVLRFPYQSKGEKEVELYTDIDVNKMLHDVAFEVRNLCRENAPEETQGNEVNALLERFINENETTTAP